MWFPWYAATMLAIESNVVVEPRLMRIAFGCQHARHESDPMASEKAGAPVKADGSLFGGATPASAIGNGREQVRANALRLVS